MTGTFIRLTLQEANMTGVQVTYTIPEMMARYECSAEAYTFLILPFNAMTSTYPPFTHDGGIIKPVLA